MAGGSQAEALDSWFPINHMPSCLSPHHPPIQWPVPSHPPRAGHLPTGRAAGWLLGRCVEGGCVCCMFLCVKVGSIQVSSPCPTLL